jgi:enoyl-CoA hydratase/carnithine racemase
MGRPGEEDQLAAMATEVKSTPHVLVETDGAIATITLNRPEKRNALSLEMMRALIAALKQIGENRAVQVVVLAANGPVFSAGHDLSELVNQDIENYRTIFDACEVLMETVQAIPQPVIGQIQGPATAAGCQLAATCDLAVAVDTAWFATPGVKIGLFCSTPMVALSRAVGRKKAMHMLLTGEPVPAREALAAGLINEVVAPGELGAATRRLADKIAISSPAVVGIGKKAFYKQIDMPQHDAYEYTKEVMSQNAAGPDAHEGISAFLEKRAPRWPKT